MAEPETDAAYQQKPDKPTSYEPDKPDENPEEPECPPPPPETHGCEPGVDDLKCVAAGDKAKSDYHDSFKEDLATAKDNYVDKRKEYRTEHHDAGPIVQTLENEARHLVERIKCQIEQKRVWKCLDDAFSAVRGEIKCCEKPNRCCSQPCNYPLEDIESKTVAELDALITEYQKRTDDAKKCFHELLEEPGHLKDRVQKAKGEVSSITSDLGGDAATLDLKQLYARALVVKWQINNVWGAFEHVQGFVDCLCEALTCWTRGCTAIYHLSGAKAIAGCKDDAQTNRCTKLTKETVDQVLAAYDRLCAEPKCKDGQSDDDDGHSHEDDENYDRPKHHHHHCDCGCD